jgi:hypothetical protein
VSAVACLHCQAAPERRQHPTTLLVMWICPVCSNRGEAHPVESRALASWQLVNDADLPLHNCKQQGAARFFMRGGRWGSRCACCDFVADGYATIEGARAGWARAVR